MTLHAAYDPDNIFARILRGEIPCVPVWEDEAVLAFMDVFPQSQGHVLVISKTSTARNLLEVEPDTLQRLTTATHRTAKAIVRALAPEGFQIMQFNGEAGGQTVFHLHFHIIPRWADRSLKGHAHAPAADIEELRRLAGLIAAELD